MTWNTQDKAVEDITPNYLNNTKINAGSLKSEINLNPLQRFGCCRFWPLPILLQETVELLKIFCAVNDISR
jgi:hypothetical protein